MEFLIYLLKMSFAFSVFYLAWLAHFRKNTFHQAQRWYLLSSMPVAILVPLIHFPEKVLPSKGVILPELLIRFGNEISKPPEHRLSTADILVLIYSGITLLFICDLSIRIWRMIRLQKKARFHKVLKLKVLENSDLFAPASFLNTLVTGPLSLDKLDPLIVQHELVHIKQWHGLDLIGSQLFFCINWFNPLCLFFNRSLKAEHEYIADQSVATTAEIKARYASLLVGEVFDTRLPFGIHTFSKPSHLKSRLMKLIEKNSAKNKLYQMMCGLPLICLLAFVSFSFTERIQKSTNQIMLPSKLATFSLAEPVYKAIYVAKRDTEPVLLQADIQPAYPGGQANLLQDLNKYLVNHYPAEARKKGIVGRVSVNFIVETDGHISHIRTIRGKQIGYGLSEAAENAVKTLKI